MRSAVRGVPATFALPTVMPLVMLQTRCFLCSAGRERVRGIEPPSPAWKAGALPLSYTRTALEWSRQLRCRGERIRTSDPLLPKQVRYQTAPRPAETGHEYNKGEWVFKLRSPGLLPLSPGLGSGFRGRRTLEGLRCTQTWLCLRHLCGVGGGDGPGERGLG
jgi:hypothetical protein